nr:hypothetical protein [Afipia sp. GAS231]
MTESFQAPRAMSSTARRHSISRLVADDMAALVRSRAD